MSEVKKDKSFEIKKEIIELKDLTIDKIEVKDIDNLSNTYSSSDLHPQYGLLTKFEKEEAKKLTRPIYTVGTVRRSSLKEISNDKGHYLPEIGE